MQSTATITVTRAADAYRDRLRAYKILVDGVASGTVKPGESLSVPVAPGPHTVQMKIDWCTSRAHTVDAAQGFDTAFECAPAGSPLTALFALLRPGAYIRLERTSS